MLNLLRDLNGKQKKVLKDFNSLYDDLILHKSWRYVNYKDEDKEEAVQKFAIALVKTVVPTLHSEHAKVFVNRCPGCQFLHTFITIYAVWCVYSGAVSTSKEVVLQFYDRYCLSFRSIVF